MNTLQRFVAKERKYLSQLNRSQRSLLWSFFLFSFAAPFIFVYAATFVWRQSHDPLLVIQYTAGFYAGVMVTFYLNGLLMRWFSVKNLFLFGSITQGVAPVLLVFFGGTSLLPYVGLFGLLNGFAAGFYWANRNTVTSYVTAGPHRFQFISLENAAGTFVDLFFPFIIGWSIVLLSDNNILSSTAVYQIFAVIGMILLGIAGLLLRNIPEEDAPSMKIRDLFFWRSSENWKHIRWIEILSGLIDGSMSFVPLLLTLTFLGQEDAVGTIEALTSVLGAFTLYTIGKRIQHADHAKIIGAWILLSSVGYLLFALFYTPWSLLVSFVLSGLVVSFRWSSLSAVMYEVVDQEAAQGTNRFVYLLDRELFLGVGRILALVLFYLLYSAYGETVLRWGLLLITVFQLPLLYSLKRILPNLSKTPSVPMNAPAAIKIDV